MRFLLLAWLSLLGCGGPTPSPRIPTAGERMPGPVVDRHPECEGATEVGPLATLGCRPHCLPASRPDVVCTDSGPYLYLPAGTPTPRYVAVREAHPRCPDGWVIKTIHNPRQYTDFHFSWAAFSSPGDFCSNPSRLEWGWFGRNLGRWDYYEHVDVIPNEGER